MNNYVIEDKYTRFIRISKAKARALWGTVDIALCPCKLRPGFPWAPHLVVSAKSIQEGKASEYDFIRSDVDFDNFVRNFECYNCTCNETGTYTAFYLMEEL